MTWIFFTFLAAFMQSWRNAFQSRLSGDVKTAGVTLARFLWAGPLAALYLAVLYQVEPIALPTFNSLFVIFIVGASLMQILATALMVKLFKFNNYAVGAGLAKSEALVAAILGMLFFGTHLSLLGWIGVLLGGIGVFMLSAQGGFRQLSLPTILLGLGSGSAFALTSLWVREASLALGLPFPHSAAWVLLLVISLQTVLLVGYLLVRDIHTLKVLWSKPKLTLLTSVSSCVGSIGWFSAMSLQAVPYVKTLGQVEIFFTMLISVFWLKQRVRIKDGLGLILVALAAVMVMWT
ncbi:DMT family transporter [Vibrio fluvialis]|jgi:drug/metabolite transporter (DMT)-like permease|uniref:Permease of the drug/metabolite transporter (DMT) superfamily n=1 Tax=Vibrio fluvialis PG41 TaxID=1336752 RepID=S7JEJ5_VIBFL|nr:DMT family transporter [Vibrio fluvialis]EKO3383379.1 DMT family transporter [Vibrio fluvialis]EKO3429725.1 DMT family transporter [Vibrio fluvialis]EKO3481204.1 DMT family transporter [Vibrio fluvialis]EKO3997748.1 DMT family transporter [Vibrio fluvialis]ELE8118526.1 DMT family transporter [Vibrio fluvialis]